jgi:hypothetical protein
MRRLSERDRLLVELVHMLSYGDKLDFGLTLEEVVEYLEKPIPRKQNRNALQCLDADGERFLQQLKDYLVDRKS